VLLEARSGREIWRFLPPDDPDYRMTGSAVSFVPDLDSDGFHDCLVANVGYPSASSLVDSTGIVFVLNGLTASVIREHFGSTYGSGSSIRGEQFGWSLLGIEDVTSDGRGDYVISSPLSDLGQGTGSLNGEIECFSGSTGALVWRYSGQPNELMGKALALGPDLTGDQVPEILVSAEGAYIGSARLGKVYILDARTGNWLRTLDGLPVIGSAFTNFGSALGVSAQLDADDIPDIVVGAGTATTAAGVEAGYVAAFSGSSGQLLWRYDSEIPGARLGASGSGLDDLDLDGYSEVLAGATAISTYHPTGIGEALVLSGRDGSLLWRIATSSAHYQNYGFVVRGYGQNGRLDHALISEPFLGPVSDGAIHVVEFQPYLEASALTISSAAGGLVHYQLDFPQSEAGVPYALLASTSGRGPTLLGGLLVPLTRDAALVRCIANRYPQEFLLPRGILDAQGDSDAGLMIASGRLNGFIGRTIHLAAVTGISGTGRLSSIAVPLTVQP